MMWSCMESVEHLLYIAGVKMISNGGNLTAVAAAALSNNCCCSITVKRLYMCLHQSLPSITLACK